MRPIDYKILDRWGNTVVTEGTSLEVCSCSKASVYDILNNNYFDDEYIVCQYTGIKDIDGVKIYEGDIVSFEADTEAELGFTVGRVEFEDAGFIIANRDYRASIDLTVMMVKPFKLKVIGGPGGQTS